VTKLNFFPNGPWQDEENSSYEASMIAASRCCLALAFGLGACSVDDRTLALVAADGGAAGASEETDAGNAEGGAAGASSTDGLVNGCADLDTDGVADCEVTLLQTPTFASDVSGWNPLNDASLTWDPKNALTDLPSGSAKLSAPSPIASASQCVALSGAQLVIAYASAFVEPAGDAPDQARAALEVSFFDEEDCGGASNGYFETPPSTVMGKWTTIQAGGLSTETTSSVLVELVGVKAASAAELNVYFDNVMLRAKAP
jgi:hypothetical protein